MARSRATLTSVAPGVDARRLRQIVEETAHLHVPTATYRLQFHADFGFAAAHAIVDYLHDLGISDLYASPYVKARSGSTHGYDVADPNVLNPELGTEEEYRALSADLQKRGVGQLVDVVPNHMGIGDPGNYRWLDVLENGPASIFARFFDITWYPPKGDPEQGGKLVMPILGDQYGRVLENGELGIAFDAERGSFAVRYWDHRFPLAPDTYPLVIEPCLETLQDELGRRHEHAQELASILTALRHLPPRELLPPAQMEERNREKEIVKRRIRELYAAQPIFRDALERELKGLEGTPGQRASFDRLDAIIGVQSYRLAFWRVAAEEINYRRFFDVSELAAVRMEDPTVFDETHRLLMRLVSEGALRGLRIDHPDGLRDPNGYFWMLQRACLVARCLHRVEREMGVDRPTAVAALRAVFDDERQRDPRSPLLRSFYVVAEKILSAGEALPPQWPIHGTTGYDYLNVLNGLFVERKHERFFDQLYSRFTRRPVNYADLANSTKKMVMLISLASEVNDLASYLKRLASADRRYRDFTLNGLTFAIREIIAALPVYRTYVDPFTGAMTRTDRAYLEQATAEAKRRNLRTDPSLFEFVRDTLLLRHAGEGTPEERAEHLSFVARFQQVTGPVMAKGVEDTAFYQYNRLCSLNEVGGEPQHFGTSLTGFHRHNGEQARSWPATMLGTSTHDTKRSEDVRARINVLSELPREWQAALTRWSRLNARKKPNLGDGRQAPDRNEEYLLYQVLLGAWPLQEMGAAAHGEFVERTAAFILKAIREAKVNTSWINPNAAYEEGVQAFVRAILDRGEPNPFLDDFQVLCQRVAYFGAFNSLSQTLIKLTSPGVPDIYQGNETWDFSLVDPDNRRPVDYALRRDLLQSVRKAVGRKDRLGATTEMLASWRDGRVKLLVTHEALALRRECPDLFAGGSYLALRAEGERKQHVCAFARAAGRDVVVTVAPILVAGLARGELVPPTGALWGDTVLRLPDGRTYRDQLTGQVFHSRKADGGPGLSLAEVLSAFPVALLSAE